MAAADSYARPFLPVYARGVVCKGFGRGSKELGIPTANLPADEVERVAAQMPTGVYFGFASVRGQVHKMVMSCGWNPYYKNTKKSMEVHILHKFDSDFYGEEMAVAVLGYLRPEKDYVSVELLIADINKDIDDGRRALDLPEYAAHASDVQLQ